MHELLVDCVPAATAAAARMTSCRQRFEPAVNELRSALDSSVLVRWGLQRWPGVMVADQSCLAEKLLRTCEERLVGPTGGASVLLMWLHRSGSFRDTARAYVETHQPTVVVTVRDGRMSASPERVRSVTVTTHPTAPLGGLVLEGDGVDPNRIRDLFPSDIGFELYLLKSVHGPRTLVMSPDDDIEVVLRGLCPDIR